MTRVKDVIIKLIKRWWTFLHILENHWHSELNEFQQQRTEKAPDSEISQTREHDTAIIQLHSHWLYPLEILYF